MSRVVAVAAISRYMAARVRCSSGVSCEGNGRRVITSRLQPCQERGVNRTRLCHAGHVKSAEPAQFRDIVRKSIPKKEARARKNCGPRAEREKSAAYLPPYQPTRVQSSC
jgi:hypothetical protein